MTHIAKLSDLLPEGEAEASETPIRDGIERLQRELAQAKADAANWFRQYNTMKCAGDSDLEIELEQTRKNWADAEARFECAEAANGDNIRALAKAQAEITDLEATVQDLSGVLATAREDLDYRRNQCAALLAEKESKP